MSKKIMAFYCLCILNASVTHGVKKPTEQQSNTSPNNKEDSANDARMLARELRCAIREEIAHNKRSFIRRHPYVSFAAFTLAAGALYTTRSHWQPAFGHIWTCVSPFLRAGRAFVSSLINGDRIEHIQNGVQQLQADVPNMRQDIAALRAEITAAAQRITDLNTHFTEHTATTTAHFEAARAEVNDLQTRLAAVQLTLTTHVTTMDQRTDELHHAFNQAAAGLADLRARIDALPARIQTGMRVLLAEQLRTFVGLIQTPGALTAANPLLRALPERRSPEPPTA